MTRISHLSLVIAVAIFAGCSSYVNSEFILEKKVPFEMPSLRIKLVSDSTCIVMREDDNSTNQKLIFARKGNHFFVVTSSKGTQLLSIRLGDTIVYHHDKMYFFDKKHKLIFAKVK